MTAYQIFEKMLKTMTDPEFHNLDKHMTLKLVHEIDDETMCETYVIDYTNTDFIKCLCMVKPSGDFPITNMEVFMDVKYESSQPVGLIFYDDKEKQHRLFSGPIYDSLGNPFCQIFFDVDPDEDTSDNVWIKRNIILDGLTNLINMTVYGIVMNM